MENKPKKKTTYANVKRVMEVGAMATPLVVVFAVFLAPLIADSSYYLFIASLQPEYLRPYFFMLGGWGIAVAVMALITVGFLTVYYIRRSLALRATCYVCISVLLTLCISTAIIASVTVFGHDPVPYVLAYGFFDLLQHIIAVIIFATMNLAFILGWVWISEKLRHAEEE
ncbi:MAG: hypothetical protein FWC00_00750 [Firmicutes bacterium]|nr:hypothetical protein [Bacillota bacterium]